MPSWNDIYSEIGTHPNTYDSVRQKYLKLFHEVSERNVIAYYSGWLHKTAPHHGNVVSISDEDKNGFMSCMMGLDFDQGLDLFIHSPGGDVAATESIIHYIRSKFKEDIRVFIPQVSMSGGTMLAFLGKEIWMGNHSNLGPIDPQFGSQPASLVLQEFDKAKNEILANPSMLNVWRPILEQIPPTYLSACEQAIDWSKEIAEKTLAKGMFLRKKNALGIAAGIAKKFIDTGIHKNHGRHIHSEQCKKIGLKIKDFEKDQGMQDLILSVHHAFMITLAETPAAKIIENHNGILYGRSVA